MPLSFAPAARRCESRKFELPPSTSTSPGSSRPSRVSQLCSVASPAGTIIHATRGGSSLATSSSSEVTVRAGSVRAYVSTSCPWRRRRSAMLAPMRPSPTSPMCIRR